MDTRRRGTAAGVGGGRPGARTPGARPWVSPRAETLVTRPVSWGQGATMSRLYDLPEPSQIDYHRDLQVQRVEQAKKMIDVGDVIAIVESRLSEESDPTQHPL